jgi:hypothetical protein
MRESNVLCVTNCCKLGMANTTQLTLSLGKADVALLNIKSIIYEKLIPSKDLLAQRQDTNKTL